MPLCNSEGVGIHYRGYEARDEEFKKLGIWLGGVFSEQIEGTKFAQWRPRTPRFIKGLNLRWDQHDYLAA
jgi:hypothetical protein